MATVTWHELAGSGFKGGRQRRRKRVMVPTKTERSKEGCQSLSARLFSRRVLQRTEPAKIDLSAALPAIRGRA